MCGTWTGLTTDLSVYPDRFVVVVVEKVSVAVLYLQLVINVSRWLVDVVMRKSVKLCTFCLLSDWWMRLLDDGL